MNICQILVFPARPPRKIHPLHKIHLPLASLLMGASSSHRLPLSPSTHLTLTPLAPALTFPSLTLLVHLSWIALRAPTIFLDSGMHSVHEFSQGGVGSVCSSCRPHVHVCKSFSFCNFSLMAIAEVPIKSRLGPLSPLDLSCAQLISVDVIRFTTDYLEFIHCELGTVQIEKLD